MVCMDAILQMYGMRSIQSGKALNRKYGNRTEMSSPDLFFSLCLPPSTSFTKGSFTVMTGAKTRHSLGIQALALSVSGSLGLANLMIDRFAPTSVHLYAVALLLVLYGDPDQLNVLNECSVLD